jgi:Fic family protein
MKIREKLQIIKGLLNLTQSELAAKLGVSFVAFNNWWNEKSVPRGGKTKEIDSLYKECTGQNEIPDDVLVAKKLLVKKQCRQYRNVMRKILHESDLYDQFLLSLTYNSNKMEGSTLSENETAGVMFRNSVLKDKSLVEQLEVKNHQAALEYLWGYLIHGYKKIDETLILRLHAILLNSINASAGNYRTHGVRIVGSYVPTANYLKIPKLMKELVDDLEKKPKDIIAQVARLHARFEQIHPFADGNGRIGRLIMSAMFLRQNIPPAIIKQESRQFYYAALQKAQLKEDYSNLEDFISEAVFLGLKLLRRG